jgi:hypothetical protein
MSRLVASYRIRFVVSAMIVLAASSPYVFSGAIRSSAGAPWLWAFLLESHLGQSLVPTSTVVLYLATAALLAAGALRRLACYLITGWCVLNAVIAFVMNFQLYAA